MRRSRGLRVAVIATAVTAALLIDGCAGATGSAPSPSSAPTSAPSASSPPGTARLASAQAQAALDTWAVAALAHDEPAFTRRVSTQDPAFAARSATLWTTLDGLPVAALSLTLAARTTPLSEARQSLLGSRAWAQETLVTWRLAGEALPATHRVWFTFVPDGDAVDVAGTTDGDTTAPQPLWWTEPVAAATVSGSVALVAGEGAASAAQARTWARRAAAAARDVAVRIDPDRRWPGRLVIQVPRDQTDFERVLGVRAGSYAQIAAVAWPEGPDPTTAALRIIVNPHLVDRVGEGSLGAEGLAILLTHEATHVATRSASSPAPTWLVEGYADAIAYDAHPTTVDSAAAIALDDVTRHGPPSALPSAADFAPGAARLDLTYARAWLACRYVAGSSSDVDLNRLYEAADRGESLDAAFRSVLGVSETTFVRGWQGWLTTAAKDR